MFKDLKTGDLLYIYDRVAISLTNEKVVSVSAPYMDKGGLMVDVVLPNITYKFRDSSEIGFTETLAVSANRECVLREVECQKTSNENILSRVDKIREELTRLDKVIDVLSPERKEKKMMEDRLNRIEAMMEKLINNSKPVGNGSK